MAKAPTNVPSYVHGASEIPLLGETIGRNLDRTAARCDPTSPEDGEGRATGQAGRPSRGLRGTRTTRRPAGSGTAA